MRSINLFVSLLFLIVVSCNNSGNKKYLKWGKYKWEITMSYDSVSVQKYYYDSLEQVEKVYSEKISRTVISFRDTSIHHFDLGREYVDTILQINPVTLEEEMIIEKFHTTSYHIDAGKISVKDFRKLLKSSVSFPLGEHLQPEFPSVEVASKERYIYSYFDFKTDKILVPELKPGEHAVVQFRAYNSKTYEPITIGKVLFEII